MEMTRSDFVNYLRNTLIPDLLESGSNAMASDLSAAVLFIEGANEVEIGESAATRPKINSKHVTTITVTDPDSNAPVDIEIIKMETGPMVGIDSSYFDQLDEDEHPHSPYDVDYDIFVPEEE